ncbi:MAG: DUF1857 family protein [Zoogloea sp.]|nr:DUF1857 family protein [Zoogloea sp.]
MRFEHLIEINDPLNPLIEPLTREQVWEGLMYRVEEPGVFLPGLDNCEILERDAGKVERRLSFGQATIHDSVRFELLEWVCFESRANEQHAGGSLTIRLEQPDMHRLYLRFTYETSLPEGMAEGVQVAEYVKSAYRESDVDTVRIIRMIAENGRPQ